VMCEAVISEFAFQLIGDVVCNVFLNDHKRAERGPMCQSRWCWCWWRVAKIAKIDPQDSFRRPRKEVEGRV
jgi:hypothetical protein